MKAWMMGSGLGQGRRTQWALTKARSGMSPALQHIYSMAMLRAPKNALWGRDMTRLVRFAGVALAALAVAGCSEGQPQAKGGAPPPPTVTVAKPVRKLVVDQDEYVGRFVAVDSVEVRARVGGYLERINFTDGQMVKTGDLLFVIDRRPYRHVLEQAKANLAQARANLAYAQSDLDRGALLVKDHTITQQLYDQRLQTKNVAEANVKAQEEAVATAELDQNSPSCGRRSAGASAIGVFRLETSSPAALRATRPCSPPSCRLIRSGFEFTFDEAAYLRYERLAREGKDVTSREGSTIVAVKLIDEKDFAHQGRLDFVDNVIDKASGTIRGRAVLPNPDGVLTPGMFGRIRVPGTPPYLALLVPEVAIGTEQARKFLLVVAPDGTVQQKFVTFGQAVGSMRVVKDGLASDDRVVVNGLMRARPGQKVTPQEGRRRSVGRHPRPRSANEGARYEDLAFFHRPADLRLGGLDRFRDPRGGLLCAPAGRAVSRDRASGHHRDRSVPGASAETVADTVVTPIEQQINGVEGMLYVGRTRPPTAGSPSQSRSISASISTSHRSRCRTGSPPRPRVCRCRCSRSASWWPRVRPIF